MNSKDVKGITVISIANGTKLGTVEHAYLDPKTKRVVGFAAHRGGGLLSAEPDIGLVIGSDEIHSLGPDALTLDDAAATSGTALDENLGLILLSDLNKLQVYSEGGTLVGQVASADFDEQSFDLTGIEASPGFFQANTTVPIDQVLTIGQDVVVVSDAALAQTDGEPQPEQDQQAAPALPADAGPVSAGGVSVTEGRSVVAGEGFTPAAGEPAGGAATVPRGGSGDAAPVGQG